MKLQKIYTDRNFQRWPSWDLVYEWEDIFKELLQLKLTDSRDAVIVTKFIDRVLLSLSRRLKLSPDKLLKIADGLISKSTALYFEMFKPNMFQFSNSKNTVPIIIDFWKTQDLDEFYRAYKNCKFVFISSKEVYDYLKNNKCPLNIRHVPLSISDKYKTDLIETSNRKVDIILAGRTSPMFWKYLQEYERKNPAIEYVYAKNIDDQLYYLSNKTGIIGNYQNREDYLKLLKTAKVAFYSTPGIDGQEERTGGFNPVTPRLFELAVAGCYIMARYPQNTDTDFYQLPLFYPSVNSYQLFEEQLNNGLKSNLEQVQKHNNAFLANHYTSGRVHLISQILK